MCLITTYGMNPARDVLHGTAILDPYRWLEDRNLPATGDWISRQQQYCDDYFSRCGNTDAIRRRVREYLDVTVVDQPAKQCGSYFYRRRDCGQEQACIYQRAVNSGRERLLVDPSGLGIYASVGIHCIAENGSLLAYYLRHGGSDRKAIHIVDLISGRRLPDMVESGHIDGFAFAADGGGFFYCRENSRDDPYHAIFFHAFNSMEDRAVFHVARSMESRLVLTADQSHLGAIWLHQEDDGLVEDFWIAPQSEPGAWHRVFSNRQLPFAPILKRGRIYAISHQGAINGKFVELNEEGAELRTIIPEQKAIIRQIVIAANKAFVSYSSPDHCIRCWDLFGQEGPRINVPSNRTIHLLAGANDGSSIFYSYESFAQPPAVYEYDLAADRSELWHRRTLGFTTDEIALRQTKYSSHDGTSVPITLAVKRHSEIAPPYPVVMTSYGGFGASTAPQFSALASILMEHGATIALPHIRGGGEFGKLWHDAGRGRNRRNTFEDFIAAAEWLCTNGITSPHKLAILGSSNSGLLVGVAMTQHPDLFRAILCIAPLLDMIRYEHFDRAARWRQEYGTVEDSDDFHALYSYSPYHQVREDENYPSTLFVCGDKDDRCNAVHVRKMAARLQGRRAQSNPVLVDYIEEWGHCPSMPLSVRVEALTRRVAFLEQELGMTLQK